MTGPGRRPKSEPVAQLLGDIAPYTAMIDQLREKRDQIDIVLAALSALIETRPKRGRPSKAMRAAQSLKPSS